MEEPRPTFEELKALRVIDLRKRLTDLGLMQSGMKITVNHVAKFTK